MEYIDRLFDYAPSLGVSLLGLLASWLVLRSLWKSIRVEPKAAAYYSAAEYLPKVAFPDDPYPSVFRFCVIDFFAVVVYFAAVIIFPQLKILLSFLRLAVVILAVDAYMSYNNLLSDLRSSTIDTWLHEKEPVLPEFALRFLSFPKLTALLYSMFNILILFSRFYYQP